MTKKSIKLTVLQETKDAILTEMNDSDYSSQDDVIRDALRSYLGVDLCEWEEMPDRFLSGCGRSTILPCTVCIFCPFCGKKIKFVEEDDD